MSKTVKKLLSLLLCAVLLFGVMPMTFAEELMTYTVTYDANGGMGAPEAQIKYEGCALVLSDVEPTQPNKIFFGWNTEPDGTGISYAPGSCYYLNADLTLYAMWRDSPVPFPRPIIEDFTLRYKETADLNLKFHVPAGTNYTVSYQSADPSVATVNEKGEVYGAKRGITTIRCTIEDVYGNRLFDTCTVTVNYELWQWLIVVFLFGWIWY